MKNIFLILLSIFAINLVNAQEQWASSVIKYSSQAGYKAYSAKQVLGWPNALQSGKNPVAWSPQGANAGLEYIQVGFDTPQKVKQIAVWENMNPGAIFQIHLIEPNGKSHQVYELKQPEKVMSMARMFRHSIKQTSYLVSEVKIVLNTAGVFGLNQIDAIGISDSDEPMRTRINNPLDKNYVGKPENLGYAVNSQAPDLLPLISVDGQTLYFARKNHPDNFGPLKKDDIYVSQKNSKNAWKEAYNIGPPLNDDYNNFVCAVNPDGTEVLISGKYDQGEGLYRTSLINGMWTNPKKIHIDGYNNKSLYVCYHVSPDMKYLVIAMEDQATYGDMDIYVSFQKSDGSYTKPKNLGPIINTAGTEPSVFLSADGKTIYFSSDGHPGYGAYDMYMSRRLDNSWQKWSLPVNLGPKINSDDWDLYYTVPANGEYAYYSSSKNSYGESDLYRIKLPKDVRPEPVAILKPNFVNVRTNTPIAQLEKNNKAIVINDEIKTNLYEEVKGFYPVNETEDLSDELEEVDGAVDEEDIVEEQKDPIDDKMNDLLARLQALKNEQAKTDVEINELNEESTPTKSNRTTASKLPEKNTDYSNDLEDKLAQLRSNMDKISSGEKTPTASVEQETKKYNVKPSGKYTLSEEDLQRKAELEEQLNALEQKQNALEDYKSSSDFSGDITPREKVAKTYDLRETEPTEFLSEHQSYRDRLEELKLAKEKSAYEPQPLTKYALKKTQIDDETKEQLVANSLTSELNELKQKQETPTLVNPEVEAYRKKLEALKEQQNNPNVPTKSGTRITTQPKTTINNDDELATTAPEEVDEEVLAFQQKLEELKSKMNNIPSAKGNEDEPVAMVEETVQAEEPVVQTPKANKRKNKLQEVKVEIAEPIVAENKQVDLVETNPSDFQEELESVKAEKENLESEVTKATEQKNELLSDLNNLSEETEEARKAKEDALKEKERVEADKKAVENEKIRLEEEKAEMERQKQELQDVIDALQKEREQFLADQEKLNNERAKLEKIRLAQFKEVKQLEQEIKALQTEKGQVQSEVALAKENAPKITTTPIDQEIFLMPVEIGTTVEIRNVFFNANSAYVKPQSYKELDKVVAFLKVNNNITIEIGGHTNGLCEDAFCKKLSTNRAKAVAEYIVNKGVSGNRIQYKGYGKTLPIADNKSTEGRKKNQRVELKILEVE